MSQARLDLYHIITGQTVHLRVMLLFFYALCDYFLIARTSKHMRLFLTALHKTTYLFVFFRCCFRKTAWHSDCSMALRKAMPYWAAFPNGPHHWGK
ncbi:hypothetical protein [Magnetococcus sp. PR-3]|uniref:hypothetical protein n=1 Tax=Magnetococcus sp. PR-3 TaxID=3120355 RepID=UPI002FCE546A